MSTAARQPQSIWRAPLWIALLSAVGLVAALVGDGAWDKLSWLALGAPLGVIGWALRRAGRAA